MIRVAYIAAEPTPWRSPYLDLIADHPQVDLTVVYAAPTVHRRQWTVAPRHAPVVLHGPSLPLGRLLHHDYPLTPQVWGLLGRERFDVLLIGGWSLLSTQLALLWARVHGTPYLLAAENHLGEPRPAWVSAIKSAVLRHVVPQASGVLVPGTLARAHALHYGARPDRITLFPNTIDVGAYRAAADRLRPRRAEIRAGLGIAAESVVVTQVGRLLPQKGVSDTIEATARARRRTDRRLHLLLVGDGPLRAALERRAAQLELDATFAGFREGDPLLECYVASDVFALLSTREPWGVVVNEAAAFGLPLVLSDQVGAAADLLRPGENGELVRAGDVDDQARALARLADETLRRRYGPRSLELVEPWSIEQFVEPLVAAIQAAARV